MRSPEVDLTNHDWDPCEHGRMIGSITVRCEDSSLWMHVEAIPVITLKSQQIGICVDPDCEEGRIGECEWNDARLNELGAMTGADGPFATLTITIGRREHEYVIFCDPYCS